MQKKIIIPTCDTNPSGFQPPPFIKGDKMSQHRMSEAPISYISIDSQGEMGPRCSRLAGFELDWNTNDRKQICRWLVCR